jgi:hypothetical protein
MASSTQAAGADIVRRLRLWLLGILVVGLLGTVTELILLKHYEQPLQFVPLVLIAMMFLAIGWRLLSPGAASLYGFMIVSGLFVASGFLGMAAHFHGSAEFQRELNPAIGFSELMDKILHAQAPPLLAPGMMLQLGLIGLAYLFSDARYRGDKS